MKKLTDGQRTPSDGNFGPGDGNFGPGELKMMNGNITKENHQSTLPTIPCSNSFSTQVVFFVSQTERKTRIHIYL